MTETEENKLKMYEELGISPALHKYGESIEEIFVNIATTIQWAVAYEI